jgi:hypothetical protein
VYVGACIKGLVMKLSERQWKAIAYYEEQKRLRVPGSEAEAWRTTRSAFALSGKELDEVLEKIKEIECAALLEAVKQGLANR